MKQKIIIGFSMLLFIAVVFLIVADLFMITDKNLENPEIYNIGKLTEIDSSQICYLEEKRIKTTLAVLSCVAVDDGMNIIICGDSEVQVYDKNQQKIADFTVDTIITSVAVGVYQEIYLGMSDHIEVYDISGKRTNKWLAFNTGSYITSIASTDHDVFIADAGNKIILRYDRKGNLLNTIGRKDKTRGMEGFIIPSMYFDVAIGIDNELWAANAGRRELQNFSPEGKMISFWGKASMQLEGFAGCCNPAHFAILPDGYFVTYEKGLNRIKIYNQAGKYVCAVSESFNTGETLSAHSVNTPVRDITVDNEGKIYILDEQQSLVRIFVKKTDQGEEP